MPQDSTIPNLPATNNLVGTDLLVVCQDPNGAASVRKSTITSIVSAGGGGGGGLSGNGSPEGAQTAAVGTTYWDVAGQSLWIKNTGAGNTGWKQIIA